jgi:hypothetical protein
VENVLVPEGHEVYLHRVSPSPGVVTSPGGIWFAHVGSSSDDAPSEIDALIARVEELAGGVRPRVLLCAEMVPLQRLFETALPALEQEAGVVAWVLHAGALAGAEHATRVIQKWLRAVHQLSKIIRQIVCVHGVDSPRARVIPELLLGMGIHVQNVLDDGTTSVEVRRPDAMIVAGLVGSTYSKERVDVLARVTNASKDEAGSALDLIERYERKALSEKLAPAKGQPPVASVDRSPRLARFLLAVADDRPDAFPALCEELLRRTVPLLVIVNPQTMGGRLRRFPGGDGLAVYSDVPTLNVSALAIGMQPGSFAGAETPPDKLFPWAASHGWMIAICVFRAPDKPLYIKIEAKVVRQLAQTLAAKN